MMTAGIVGANTPSRIHQLADFDVTTTAPPDPVAWHMWLDPSGPTLSMWDGSAWVEQTFSDPVNDQNAATKAYVDAGGEHGLPANFVRYRGVNQTIPNATTEPVDFDTFDHNDVLTFLVWRGAFLDFEVQRDCFLQFECGVSWLEGGSNGAGNRRLILRLNGADLARCWGPPDLNVTAQHLSRTAKFVAGDLLSVAVRHSDGASVDIGSGLHVTWVSITVLRDLQ